MAMLTDTAYVVTESVIPMTMGNDKEWARFAPPNHRRRIGRMLSPAMISRCALVWLCCCLTHVQAEQFKPLLINPFLLQSDVSGDATNPPGNDGGAIAPLPQDEGLLAEDNGIPLHDCPTREQLRAAIKPIGEIQARLSVDPSLLGEEGTPLNCSYYVFEARQPARALFPGLIEFNWQPTNFFHQPLYFDDQPLERYGQTTCWQLQPIISGSRFFFTVPVVPYKIGLNPLHEPVTTLGYDRPGNCTPCVRERIIPRLEGDAALLQAATVLALVFILP